MTHFIHIRIILFFSIISSAIFFFPSFSYSAPIDPEELHAAISERKHRVAEFREISRMAHQRQLRVWLFGGSAASFAHYVRWDLLREGGDRRFQPYRFDYDFTNIFRFTQDIDLVVDGSVEEVLAFQKILQEKFPYFIGKKEQWEVRPLRIALGDKGTLLDDPDFMNQHTDSNSVGMIELSESDEPVVRDLRHWDERSPPFLCDTASGKIQYYFSSTHETTSRYLSGKNPPILSVIRYLIKVFQFELKIDPKDWKVIQRIVDEFDGEVEDGSYLLYWLEKNGPKLINHAVDIAYAWNVLEKLGLREKLIQLSNPNQIESLGWYMNKEPLRDFKDKRRLLPLPPRKRAKDLRISVVTHTTKDFTAYEVVRRSHQGIPNVWISRKKVNGETAMLGNGFYTSIGKPKGYGFNIEMKVDPHAREGKDFIKVENGILWLTRDKLKIIHTSLKLTLPQTIKFLLDPETQGETGLLEICKRRLNSLLSRSNARLLPSIETTIEKGIKHALPTAPDFSYFEPIESLAQILGSPAIARLPKWKGWVDELVFNPSPSRSVMRGRHIDADILRVRIFLSQSAIWRHPKWVYEVDKLIMYYNETFHGTEKDQLMMEALTESILGNLEIKKRFPARWERWVEALIQTAPVQLFYGVFSKNPELRNHPNIGIWMKIIFPEILRESKSFKGKRLRHLTCLTWPELIDKSEWNNLIETAIQDFPRYTIDGFRANEEHYEYIEKIFMNRGVISRWDWGEWVKRLIAVDPKSVYPVLESILIHPDVIPHPQWKDVMTFILQCVNALSNARIAITISLAGSRPVPLGGVLQPPLGPGIHWDLTRIWDNLIDILNQPAVQKFPEWRRWVEMVPKKLKNRLSPASTSAPCERYLTR